MPHISEITNYLDTALNGYLTALLRYEIIYCGDQDCSGSTHTFEARGAWWECGVAYDTVFDVWNFSDESGRQAETDIVDFCLMNWADVNDLEPGQVGTNFYLNRNRHGAGFWDRGLGERGDRLTAASHPYGETNLGLNAHGEVVLS